MAIKTCDYANCDARNHNGSGPCTASEVTYPGAVLETYEANGYDDSDFYAIVWDAETGKVKSVCYATTRGWTYHNNATVDATPEVQALAREWAASAWESTLTDRAETERMIPNKGTRVRSLTKRGKNVGVEGPVMWYGVNTFKSDRWMTYYRVGVKVTGEEKLRYLDADRVEVIGAPEVDRAEIARTAASLAETRSIRSAMEAPLSGLIGPVKVTHHVPVAA